MNAKKKIAEKLASNKPSAARMLLVFRKVYNNLCFSCRAKTVRLQGKIDYGMLCDDCRIMAKSYEEEMNEAL